MWSPLLTSTPVIVDEHAFQSTGNPGGDVGEPRFVVLNLADHSNTFSFFNLLDWSVCSMKDFYKLVMSSIDAGIDMIITGAGFSRDIFKIGREHNTPIVMIVSSPALAKLSEKLGAAAVIVEAKEAGGHLGTDKPLREIFPPIRDVVKNIPLIAAGGITNGYEMAEMMDKYGADGIQIASRFVSERRVRYLQ